MSDVQDGAGILAAVGAALAGGAAWALRRFATTKTQDREEQAHRDMISTLEHEVDRKERAIDTKDKELAGLREELRIERRLRSEDLGMIERLRARLESAQAEVRRAKQGLPDEFLRTNFGGLDDLPPGKT